MKADFETLPMALQKSSLLYTARSEQDGELMRPAHMCREFAHDTHLDFFLARWFADNINSGSISVEGACHQFWTYQEDPKLWKLEDVEGIKWRSVLPAWRPILVYVGDMVSNHHKASILRECIINYVKVDSAKPEPSYNPFEDDIVLAGEIIGLKSFSLKLMSRFRDSEYRPSYGSPSYLKYGMIPESIVARGEQGNRGSKTKIHRLLRKLEEAAHAEDARGTSCSIYEQIYRAHTNLKPSGLFPARKELSP